MARIKSRVVWIVALLLSITAAGVAVWRLWPSQERSLVLPDGSRVTLLRVTLGTNHVCRLETGWRELVYPFLPRSLKAKLSSGQLQFSTDKDALMVWFRWDDIKSNARGLVGASGMPQLFISVVDENGIESQLQSPNSFSLRLGKAAAAAGAASPPPLAITSGWQLQSYPTGAKELRIRIYDSVGFGRDRAIRAGEISIQNPTIRKSPVSSAENLPATRKTNSLEVTLTKFETGLTSKRTGLGPASVESRCFSRATFGFKENGIASQKWSVFGVDVKSADGKLLPRESMNPRWMRGEHVVDFSGGLWLEEPAWFIDVEIARTDDFPSDELWTIANVPIPADGKIAERREIAKRSGREFEFQGVSAPNAALPDQFTGIRPHANFHVRTPFPLTEWHFSLVEIKDDRGREVRRRGVNTAPSIVGGATVKHLLYAFAFDVPDDAKSLNVTFAITPSRHVQFVAKPTLFNE